MSIIISKNMDIFVIPNGAGLISEFMCGQDKKLAYFQEMAELNGLEFDPEKDKLVQLWFVETDENGNHTDEMCDNCCRHAWLINGYKTRIREELLPQSWISGKEGDQIHLKFKPFAVLANESYSSGNEEDLIIDATIRLKQQLYRYRQFGDFEEVVEKVCRR